MTSPSPFRDFGLLPDGLTPPSGAVRAYFSSGRVIGQYIGTGLFLAVGAGACVASLWAPFPLNVLGCVATLLGFGAGAYLFTRCDYGSVELEGDTLRARHLYTGCVLERSLIDIESLFTMSYQVRQPETIVIEKLLGRVKGVEIRFRGERTVLRILRADPAMTNAQELVEAILYRMSRIGPLDAEIVDFAGKPLVRSITWRGMPPPRPGRDNGAVILASVLGLGLLFGPLFGLIAQGELETRRLASVPPHEITLRELIDHGPGENRHVTLTQFDPGGYTLEVKSGSWNEVWLAMFPTAPPGAPPEAQVEIQVVFLSKAIRDEADLRQTLQAGRVTGICTTEPRTGWGATLGPSLVQANQGRPLRAAWLVTELRRLPSKTFIAGVMGASTVSFVVALACSGLIFWRS